jgi:F-type H+-transporting ATPase subunit b
MFLSLTSSLLLLAGSTGGSGASGGAWESFKHFYNDWFNIGGFEAWKFVNLAIFVAFMVYVLKKPLSEAFKAKREQIRAELIKAEAEKQAALAKLTSVEAKLAQLESEKEEILKNASEEAAFEKNRLAEQTRADIERLSQQSNSELSRLSKQSLAALKRFSAQESIRLAEAKLRAQIDGTVDARLVKASISEIGGLN